MVAPVDEQASGEEGALFSQVADLLRTNRTSARAELRERLICARSDLEHFFAQHPYSVTCLRLLAECAQQLDDLPQAQSVNGFRQAWSHTHHALRIIGQMHDPAEFVLKHSRGC